MVQTSLSPALFSEDETDRLGLLHFPYAAAMRVGRLDWSKG